MKSALIVIDVQMGLFTRETPIFKAGELLKNINSLIRRARSCSIPIFVIQHSSPRLIEGSDNWKLHPELTVKHDDIFIKKNYSNSFRGTPLKTELDKRKIKKLVIAGIWTHNCVQATCYGAKELDYNVNLVEDAHSRDGSTEIAKRSINEWNTKLSIDGTVTLRRTEELEFC